MKVDVPHVIITSECNPLNYNCILVEKKILNSPQKISDLSVKDKYIITGEMWDSLKKIFTKIPESLFLIIRTFLENYYMDFNLFELKKKFEINKISFHTKENVQDYLKKNNLINPTPDIEELMSIKEKEFYRLTGDYDYTLSTCLKGDEIIQNCSGKNYIYNTKDIVKNLSEMVKLKEFSGIYSKLQKKYNNIFPCRDYYKADRHIWEFISINGINKYFIQIYLKALSDGLILEEYNINTKVNNIYEI